LDRHHQSPVEFQIEDGTEGMAVRAEWQHTDQRTRNAHANEIDATEAGACAVVLAAVEHVMRLVAIHRAETLKGADYYMAAIGSSAADLEDAIRLEISGVDRGAPGAVAYRLKIKLEQAAAGKSNLPAMAGVAGFRSKIVMLRRVEQS
jgi:hypothetical protein